MGAAHNSKVCQANSERFELGQETPPRSNIFAKGVGKPFGGKTTHRHLLSSELPAIGQLDMSNPSGADARKSHPPEAEFGESNHP